jgi:hypothetical protein
MISNPSASHSTASSAVAASVTPSPSGAFILKTISGSIFGEIMRASESVASFASASRTVSSYMCAQTSVSSCSTRHIALLA